MKHQECGGQCCGGFGMFQLLEGCLLHSVSLVFLLERHSNGHFIKRPGNGQPVSYIIKLWTIKQSLGKLRMFCLLEIDPIKHFIVFHMLKRQLKGHFVTFCLMIRPLMENFISFYLLEGKARRPFLMLCQPQECKRGSF